MKLSQIEINMAKKLKLECSSCDLVLFNRNGEFSLLVGMASSKIRARPARLEVRSIFPGHGKENTGLSESCPCFLQS